LKVQKFRGEIARLEGRLEKEGKEVYCGRLSLPLSLSLSLSLSVSLSGYMACQK
jgi:hypothetical protein